MPEFAQRASDLAFVRRRPATTCRTLDSLALALQFQQSGRSAAW